MKKRTKTQQEGIAAIFITILILAIVLNIAASIAILAYGQQRIARYVRRSSQAYFAAEAGAEDILLRLTGDMSYPDSYQLNVGDSTADISISDEIGGSRTITSIGETSDLARKIEVVYQISSADVSFYYGVQAGDLGIQMDSSSKIHGNVFSNGQIIGSANSEIHGDVVSAGPSGKIDNMKVLSDEGGGNAWAHALENCEIAIDGYYDEVNTCDIGVDEHPDEPDTDLREMPLSSAQITEWEGDAADGGTYPGGDYTLGGGSDSLGPIKVDGNMDIESNSTLTVEGTIWVTGDLTLMSNVILKLDPGYGSFSGIIVVDGKIYLDSNVLICGSEGEESGFQCNPSVGSYLMLLSDKDSADPDNPAIEALSNTQTGVLYASDGYIRLTSNASLREATGRGIYMDSNAELTYEIGLADAKFTSGPGGSWQISNWKEAE